MDLSSYVKEQRKAGYDLETIKEYLLSQGYNPKDVNVATQNHKFAFVAAFVLIGVIGVLVLLNIPESEPEEIAVDIPLSYALRISNNKLLEGETLTFTNAIRGVDRARVSYTIRDLDNNVYERFRKEGSLPDLSDINHDINLPEGRYVLEAQLEGESAEASALFEIYVESCTDGILNQNEHDIDCGGICDACSEEIIEPVAFETTSPYQASFSNIVHDAKIDASVKEDCLVFDAASQQDDCLVAVSKSAHDPSVCELVGQESQKDSCYMYFALEHNDFSICDNLTSVFVRQSCHSLKSVSTP